MSEIIQRIVVMGAGGDGLVVAEAIRQARAEGQHVHLAGFLDDSAAPGTTIAGIPVLGKLDDWEKLEQDLQFVPAIQKVRDMPRRAARLRRLNMPRQRWYTLVHSRAVVASGTHLGCGVYIAACATVQPGCSIGDFATLRASAVLGHDAIVHEHGYVGPNATLCGRSSIQEGGHLGPNAVVLDGRSVGKYAVVGIGAAVTKNVPDYAVVMGNPARRVGRVRALNVAIER